MSNNLDSILRKAFEQGPSGLLLVRAGDDCIMAVNQMFERITGFQGSEIVGRKFDEFSFWVDMEERAKVLRILFSGGKVRMQECPFIDRQGCTRIFLYSAELLKDEGENYIFVTFHDITEPKRAQESLLAAELTLRTMINAIPFACTLLNRDTLVQTVNDAAIRLYGKSSAEIMGKEYLDILSPEEKAKNTTLFQDLCKSRQSRWIEGVFHGRVLKIYCAPILDSKKDVTNFIVTSDDITAARAMHKEREELVRQLQAALTEVKTLSGLLPICANCKKIRDKEGHWQQMEYYVSEHTEASFSHGICPECMKKLYGK